MKTLLTILLLGFSCGQSFARGYNRTGVDGDQLVLVYAALATLMLLIGYAPQIWKYLKQQIPHKQRFVFIPLLTTLSGEGKTQLFLAILAFAALLFLIAYSPNIARFIKHYIPRKQYPSH